MSGASPFLGDVMALLVNGRLAVLTSRINTACLIGPAEPLPEWEIASEDERREIAR